MGLALPNVFALCLGSVLSVPCALGQETSAVHADPQTNTRRVESDVISTHQRPFISNVDVVLVPVTVTDPLGRLVTGLERRHFVLTEDSQPQNIDIFYTQDTPISVGLILDLSGSMSSAIDYSRAAFDAFMQTANPQDEFFLISFGNKPEMLRDFTEKDDEITNELLYLKTGGRTALLDAIYLGLNKMRKSKYPRRALIVFSDGGDNNSRYTPTEVLRVIQEADVQLYTIGIPGTDYAPYFLQTMTERSGGRIYEGFDWADTATKISIDLRNQYVLGYRSRNLARDGKWRKIKVKLQAPKGLPSLHVYSKTGYLAPSN